MLLWRKTPSEMANLSLDETRLMMGTQLWLKTSIIDFISNLLGGEGSDSNRNEGSGSLDDITKELERISSNPNRSFSKSKVNKEELLKEYEKDKANYNKQTGKQESVDLSKVNISNWNVIVDDNSQRRDGKVDGLAEKLKRYKSQGYIQ